MARNSKREWTILVYMAGDTGASFRGRYRKYRLWAPLEQAARDDLGEMEAVGSTDEVAVIVQFDALSEVKQTFRYVYGAAGEKPVQFQLANQNMGDPASLRDFIIWGMKEAPAERVAVVLWGHGTGWEEKDIYAYARQRKLQLQADKHEVRSAMGGEKLSGGLFLSSAARIMQIEDDEIRGICYDDSSMDFLDNADLQRAFSEASAQTGQKINLIGMDACLMNMVEVAYQLRGHGEVMVGAQGIAPVDGWPYARLIQALSKEPSMSARELGSLIVQEYGQSFGYMRGGEQYTQSAIDLRKISLLTEALKAVAHELEQGLEKKDLYMVDRALRPASRDVLRFEGERGGELEYIDLHHFLELLEQEYYGDSDTLTHALKEALKVLTEVKLSPIFDHVASESNMKDARGLSIYLPNGEYSCFYDKLDFNEVGWGRMLRLFSQSR